MVPPVMTDLPEIEDLLAHLTRSSRLSAAEAERLLAEVLAFLDETPEGYVQRRHLALQAAGLANEAIFARLAREVAARRFRAPPLSTRQIRRIVYG